MNPGGQENPAIPAQRQEVPFQFPLKSEHILSVIALEVSTELEELFGETHPKTRKTNAKITNKEKTRIMRNNQ